MIETFLRAIDASDFEGRLRELEEDQAARREDKEARRRNWAGRFDSSSRRDSFFAFRSVVVIPAALSLSIEERRRRGIAMEGYWGRQSTNTRDRATAMMPRMPYDRLDELGIDFGIIYPTAGLGIARIDDAETRRAVIRGFNIVTADYFRDLSDRLTPAAVIPMHTPEEAIEELEFVTRQLGSKFGMFGSGIRRPLPGAKGVDPEIARFAAHYDQLGLDSDYDYDPVWRKCLELKIAPTFHTGGRGLGLRNGPSNFTFNHIGHFAAAGHAVAKAIFLGGVTRRFPDLRFGFLEGGSGWACQLFADLIEHWERRGKARKGSNTWTRKSSTAHCWRSWSRNTGTRTSATNCAAATAGQIRAMTNSTAGFRCTTIMPLARSLARKIGLSSTRSRSSSAASRTTG
jgi:predicted TIM-barrel fold metal-dependent hydrolase